MKRVKTMLPPNKQNKPSIANITSTVKNKEKNTPLRLYVPCIAKAVEVIKKGNVQNVEWLM